MRLDWYGTLGIVLKQIKCSIDLMMAAVMCGGKGSRMQGFTCIEKPLLKLYGKPMVERVINALVESKKFCKIVAVTSYNVPMTKKYLKCNFSRQVDVIDTEGKSYSHDMSKLLNTLKPATILVVAADLPLLNSTDVKKIISQAEREYNICTSFVSDKQFVTALGIKPSVIVRINSKEYCHTGISVIDSANVDGEVSLAEHYVIMNETGVVVNVNTSCDLDAAERIMMVMSCHS